MSKRPSFQFYPADWRANANLRRCSSSARGAWIELMCLFHDADEYGLIRWPLKDLTKAAGISQKNAREWIEKGVLKGDDKFLQNGFQYTPVSGRVEGPTVELIPSQNGPIWYSSRMVKDEYIRTNRANSSTFGASPQPSPKPPLSDGSSTSTSSSTSSSVSTEGKPSDAGASQGARIEENTNPRTTGEDTLLSPAPSEDRRWLFNEGLNWLGKENGKAPDSLRALVGRWLRDLHDDSAALKEIFEDAANTTLADASSWITKTVRRRKENPKIGRRASSNGAPRDGWGKTKHEWETVTKGFLSHGIWPMGEGPKPGEKGCRVPIDIQRKLGVTPFEGVQNESPEFHTETLDREISSAS